MSYWTPAFLSYEPDPESVHVAPTTGDSAGDGGSQGQASISVSSRGGGSGRRASTGGNGEAEPTPPVPWDPPTGTWSVRFPSLQTKSAFLHRTSIRELRRALSTPPHGSSEITGDGNGFKGTPSATTNDAKNATTALPVFLERRELRPEPATDEGKAGGKGAKKGGGKKPPAGKKGEAPEQPPRPPETPWLCRALINLSPLVQPGATDGDAHREKRSYPMTLPGATDGASKTEVGDSPLRAELRAMLTLAPQPGHDAARASPDPHAAKGDETAARASDAMAPAAEGVGVRVG